MRIGNLFTAFIALFIGVSSTLNAQDIHFSQFYASPLNLNPATTGVMSCDMRISAIYRNQWGSVLGKYAFNTFSVGVEGKFNAGKHDFYGVGLNLWADKAGESSFSSIQGQLSGSYLKKIGGRRSNEHYLVAGAQVGFMQRSINLDQLRWGMQWNGDAFDPSSSTGENFVSTRLTIGDINAGLMWFSALDAKNKSNVYFGVAFHHLTRAKISFNQSTGESLYTKYTVHGGGEVRVARRLGIVPAFAVHFQGPSMQTNLGTAVKFDFSKRAKSSQAFQLGLWTRMVTHAQAGTEDAKFGADALIALCRIRMGSHHIGFAYDINISPLKAASRSSGGFEFSYVYTLCGGRGRKLGCPTF